MLPVKRLRPISSLEITWIDIPFKVREIIIDKMDSKTRCLFSRCSKICNEEAKKSKFYIYGLDVCEDHDDRETEVLKIQFDESGNGYWFDFLYPDSLHTIVAYRCFKSGKETAMWTTFENGFCDNMRSRYARIYLEKYQKQVQFFRFSCKKSFDFTLMHLENLKKIQIVQIPDEWRRLKDIKFIYRRQLLNIDTIELPSKIGFTSMDLFDFKGKNASVSIDDFNKENFKKYLEMLKTGEISVNSLKIVAKRLYYMDFEIIGKYLGVSNYTEKKYGFQSFDFNSDARKYLVSFEKGILKIETIEVFKKKVDQFIFWPNLPLHIQENVIDKMDSKSRCRFAQCSKDSEKEAKRSKNYLYKIGVTEEHCCHLELQFAFSENSEIDFWLHIMPDFQDQTIIVYKTGKHGEEIVKWTKLENGEAEKIRLKYLKEYLGRYGKIIKSFYFHGDTDLLDELNIKNSKNLERIHIKNNYDNEEDYVENGNLDWDLVLRCKHVILENDAILPFEKLLELDIETGRLRCDELAEEDNFKNYLNMLKNGQIHRNLKEIRFLSTAQRRLSFHGFRPFFKIEENRTSQKFSFRSNVKENQIIEVFQQFGDDEFYIHIKFVENFEV